MKRFATAFSVGVETTPSPRFELPQPPVHDIVFAHPFLKPENRGCLSLGNLEHLQAKPFAHGHCLLKSERTGGTLSQKAEAVASTTSRKLPARRRSSGVNFTQLSALRMHLGWSEAGSLA